MKTMLARPRTALIAILLVATAYAQQTSLAQGTSNLEIVRSAYEAFAEGDAPSFLTLLDERVEFIEPQGVPHEGTYFGPDEVLNEVLVPLTRQWEGFTLRPREYIDAGDRIIVLGTVSGTYLVTGRKLHAPFVGIWTIEGGKVAKYQAYTNTAAFVEATAPSE